MQNEPGVLSRVSGCLAARGFNIDSLVVCRTEIKDLSRMCIVLGGQDGVVEQVRRQLEDLVRVFTPAFTVVTESISAGTGTGMGRPRLHRDAHHRPRAPTRQGIHHRSRIPRRPALRWSDTRTTTRRRAPTARERPRPELRTQRHLLPSTLIR